MSSKIKITTYVDAEKIHEDSHVGTHIEEATSEKITYSDKNNKKIYYSKMPINRLIDI